MKEEITSDSFRYKDSTLNYKEIIMTIDDVKLIMLPKISDPRGNLSFVEQNNHIPFEIKRTYWISDCTGGRKRCSSILPVRTKYKCK